MDPRDKPSIEQVSHLFRLIADGIVTRKNFQAYLDKPNGLTVGVGNPTCPTWKTIQLGTRLKFAEDFYQALHKDGCRISVCATDILGKPSFSVASQATEVDLIKVTVSELGFPNGASVHDIYETALKRGLVRCPAEVGPQLRLQYLDQPMDDWILVGMEPITGSDGGLEVFLVARGGNGRWLDRSSGRPGNIWPGGIQWVFVRPRHWKSSFGLKALDPI